MSRKPVNIARTCRIALRPPHVRCTRPSIAKSTARTYATPAPPPQRTLTDPLNLPKWLSENSHLLKPPINNYCVTNHPLTTMVVGGPNARTDYHINSTPEWFYQYKGHMLLKTTENDVDGEGHEIFRDITIPEGSMYLLPPNVPHNPVRFANTVGVVIELPRPAGNLDTLRWYCQSCRSRVHEKSFACTDLGTQIKDAVKSFEADQGARTCKTCGEVCDVKPKPSPAL